MSIKEFGIRVDSINLLEEVLNRTFRPKSETNQLVYSKMLEWLETCGNPIFKYVYYGSEFCSKRFPSVNEWKEMASFCQKHNKVLVMMFPPADDETTKKAKDIVCDFNDSYKLKNIEIVVNDFGILEALNCIPSLKGKLVIRLGRVLDKTYHDGRLDDREILCMYENCRVKWTEDKDWIPMLTRKVLHRYPVRGIDVDIPFLPAMCEIKKESEYSIGMFIPYSYTTTGGICQMRQIGVPYGEKFDSRHAECKRNCIKYYEKLQKRVIDIHRENQELRYGSLYKNITLYRIGNTVFYIRQCSPQLAQNVISVDRLIFEPKMMI